MPRDPSCIPDVIKQESHLAAKTCLEPLTTANGYCLSNGARDAWPHTYRDGFGFTTSQDAKMVANMAAVSTGSQLSQLSSVDWTTMTSRAQTVSAAGQYYSPPLAHAQAPYPGAPAVPPPPPHHHHHHHPYGWATDATHGHAQSAYAYGMTSPHSMYNPIIVNTECSYRFF